MRLPLVGLSLSGQPNKPGQYLAFDILRYPGYEQNDEHDGNHYTPDNPVELFHPGVPLVSESGGANSKSHVVAASIVAGVIADLYLRLNSAVTPSTSLPVLMRTRVR